MRRLVSCYAAMRRHSIRVSISLMAPVDMRRRSQYTMRYAAFTGAAAHRHADANELPAYGAALSAVAEGALPRLLTLITVRHHRTRRSTARHRRSHHYLARTGWRVLGSPGARRSLPAGVAIEEPIAPPLADWRLDAAVRSSRY